MANGNWQRAHGKAIGVFTICHLPLAMTVRLLLTLALTASLGAQTTSPGRWTYRSEILDSRNIAYYCWDYSATDGKRATVLIGPSILGELVMWGASFDKNTRAEAVTQIVYLGQDATGISLEILTVPVSISVPPARLQSNPLESCLSFGLLDAAERAQGTTRSRVVRAPLEGNQRMAIGKEEVFFKISGGAGFSIVPVNP
jgi:hypothetical protein